MLIKNVVNTLQLPVNCLLVTLIEKLKQRKTKTIEKKNTFSFKEILNLFNNTHVFDPNISEKPFSVLSGW